jgi:putative membrane protein
MRILKFGLIALCLAIALSGCVVQKAQPQETAQAEAPRTTDAPLASADALGASAKAAPDSDVVELTEDMYVTYINEIYTNAEDYLGRTIRLQGMFASAYDEASDSTYTYVYRVGPGCCGNDGSMCGFEFSWDGEMPKTDDWIEVTGTLDEYEQDGLTYLTLRAKTVEEKAERGAENVYR